MIDSILKESSMTHKEFEEVKGIEKEMKESGKTEILTPTPIAVVAPEVTVAQSSAQAPNVPYVAVSQVQPLCREKETVVKPMQRKSTRIEQVKPTIHKKREK